MDSPPALSSVWRMEGLTFGDCPIVHALGDRPEKVVVRLPHGDGELKGNPLPDFPDPGNEATNSS